MLATQIGYLELMWHGAATRTTYLVSMLMAVLPYCQERFVIILITYSKCRKFILTANSVDELPQGFAGLLNNSVVGWAPAIPQNELDPLYLGPIVLHSSTRW
jgi:hypothetical protein